MEVDVIERMKDKLIAYDSILNLSFIKTIIKIVFNDSFYMNCIKVIN